nr:hypothetical protein [Tanacetum cinerariifolium]
MTSAIIRLADNPKFNFSKYIFDNMVKSLEGGVKFYMFPRFLQAFRDKQVKGMARHKVLDLQEAKDAQAKEIAALKKNVTKLTMEKSQEPPKRNSAFAASAPEAPAMTQAAIKQLVVDSVTTALETQATTMANADNANRNSKPR